MKTLRLYCQTLRWLRFRQVRARLLLFLRRETDPLLFPARLRRVLRGKAGAPRLSPCVQEGRLAATPPHSALDAAAILAGEFLFAHVTRRFHDVPDWSCPDPALRYWYYNLHYFEYGPALAQAYRAAGNTAYLERLIMLVLSWIEANPPGRGFAWDGGPLSYRIIHWCDMAFLLPRELQGDSRFAGAFLHSLFAQALFLESHLEYHLGGNHLVANGLALLYAGTLFAGPAGARWRRRGLHILEEELAEQVPGDGGHYERSPMYHAVVLDLYLRAVRLLRASGLQEPETFGDKIAAMARFLAALREPDGEFPLLNDAAFGVARPSSAILRDAEDLLGTHGLQLPAAGVAAFRETGFFVARPADRDFFLFDAGPVGPDCNPGHAHSDTLSFELALAGQRIIVDSGTYSYAADPMREYCQSTRAHNTVLIDGIEQTEKWGPWQFRAARRAKPVDVDYYEHDGLTVFKGSHTGYDHLPGQPRHVRHVLLIQGRFWIVFDEVCGGGVHAAESFLHFHPDVALSPQGATWQAAFSSGSLCILFFGNGVAEQIPTADTPPQGWYCPEFGMRLAQPVLRATVQGRLPLRFGWALLPGVREARVAAETQPNGVSVYCSMDNWSCALRQYPGGRFHLGD
ncbi:MAG: alginate lyase family protein [Candidatus Hydrogenedentes bacterium]|nr:alginate lyase family protein [Candidatus Hydrogenedentota bacterium]